jgi:hypothetical protein
MVTVGFPSSKQSPYLHTYNLTKVRKYTFQHSSFLLMEGRNREKKESLFHLVKNSAKPSFTNDDFLDTDTVKGLSYTRSHR